MVMLKKGIKNKIITKLDARHEGCLFTGSKIDSEFSNFLEREPKIIRHRRFLPCSMLSVRILQLKGHDFSS